MENRKSKRSLRVALVLGTAVAGTALVGWGGLAAWNAYTENAGNSVAAGTLSHANGLSCVSSLGVIPTSGTGWCAATITVAGVDPATWTGTTGTIVIANTGSLKSTFTLNLPAAGSGGLCADVTLKVTDLNTTVPDTGTVVAATALNTAALTTPVSLYSNATTPSLSWTNGGVAGTGTGATANTFTVTVAPIVPNFANDYADQGTSCSFGLLFSQTAA
ncbi:MAG: hypothetical protein ABR977_08125 [Candidatus Dormibacteria bacterium]|jgi:hypothetical protein